MKGAPFTQLCRQMASASSSRIDLHTHTTASDGDWAPSLLIQQAIQKKIQVLAITDHDTTYGFELASRIPSVSLTLIPGVEITTRYKDRETHLLAYLFDPLHAELQTLLALLREQRRERLRARLELLKKAGYRMEIENLFEESIRSLGRRHLARHLIQSGQARSSTEAFQKHLKLPSETSLPHVGVPLEQMIDMVHRAGGLTSLAHPPQHLTTEELQDLKFLGLDALECEYPWGKSSRTQQLREVAEQVGLLITGGSDFHGDDKGPRALGQRGISPVDWRHLLSVHQQVSISVK
ncbi:PHP domain-containing protein [Telmatocola sphagniphila]|uniref:PHP domain-containing protein n=1 Tax=Telmatocola sphagniphila TaxID=1123043 RepID=A0A8E6ETU1_9BACT|nr:PHP domain-containing protein [Telmatocola sphagniphila]QVL30550.1 PHP domain-containing protein [Telmatocola sphagniphila]